MSKKVLRLFSILFLSSILVLSCSNTNKTGSGDNNSGNGGSGTGGSGSGTDDGGTGTGGTTPTPQPDGIAKYAGTWTAKFTDSSGGISTYYVIIGSDKTVTIKDIAGEIKAENITESGNTYTMTVKHGSEVDASIVTITFDSGISGTINDDTIGNGVIKKQNNGNKGLWYYEGTWELVPTVKQQQNPTITIGNDGSVTYSNEKSTDVTDKGNEEYDIKFNIIDEGKTFILTLKFNDDSNGTFTLSGGLSGSGTLTKQ